MFSYIKSSDLVVFRLNMHHALEMYEGFFYYGFYENYFRIYLNKSRIII